MEEFKVGDWVIGWFSLASQNGWHKNAWQIGELYNNNEFARVKDRPDTCTSTSVIRHAKPHEIPNHEIQYEIC